MKKLLGYPPFHYLLCLIFGITLQFHFKIWSYSFFKLFLTSILLSLILLILKKNKYAVGFKFISLFTFLFLGITSVYIQNPKNYSNYFIKHVNNNSYTTITVTKKLKSNTYFDKYVGSINYVDKKEVKGNVLINIKKDSSLQLLKINDQIVIKPIFKELSSPLNPYQFNYKDYLSKQYIYHQISISKKHYKITTNKKFSIVRYSNSFREKIQTSLKKQVFSKDVYAIINALLLGQRQDISKKIIANYTNAGAIHLLAISGLHIGIILLILLNILKPLHYFKHGTRLKTLSIILVLWWFAFIAGLSASVVRAVTMFTFIAIAELFKKKSIIEHSLISSMFLLLLIKPLFLFDVGFQLSYIAVFGIVWIQPLLYKIWNPKFSLLNKIWKLFTVSIAAQLAILPISLYYFHQFPSLFILSNLIIIPFLGSILFFGIIIMLLSTLDLLPNFLAKIYNYSIQYMNNFMEWIANQENFLLTEIPMSLLQAFLWYTFIIFSFQLFLKPTTRKLIYTLLSISLLQSTYLVEKHKSESRNEFVIFHKNQHSIIGEQKKGKLLIYHDSLKVLNITNEKLVKAYRIEKNINTIYKNTIPSMFLTKKDTIMIIDKLGIYNVKNLKNCIVLLIDNPKINLSRLIKQVKPKLIIADGSNYKSYTNQYRLTCKKQKTPFWSTYQKGAYILN
ncbi:competence protein ComEC [Tenacibaculum sp. MAR_2010_89]|uniref:ComEC/Rec2 family competence protein n=1 Tax=Tenacibaculum sp. MAR_2010_89 TaxID=1250198 RepID=UPI000899AA08|nr:ComEC/Rec2 family competence protein [Tenacibaculum sp. MAR_2010_89]SED43079.1 competence protein ComEC [Tenacibaculum sp. MAR_2010_89]